MEGNQRMEKKWERVTLKEETVLYMEIETGELSLKNPEADEDWEMYKSTTTEKVAYFCQQNGERNGPRETTKPKEKGEQEWAMNKNQAQEPKEGTNSRENKQQSTMERDGEEIGETIKVESSKRLLWTLRFDADDWVLGKKWKDYYYLEEVVNIPPLQEIGMEEEASWQIAVRDIKRYEVAVVQGKRLVKAKHRAPRKKQKQK